MPNSFVNKKKVRGWKRQIKKFQRWQRSHIQLDVNCLKHSGFDYVKMSIDKIDNGQAIYTVKRSHVWIGSCKSI